MKKDKEIMNEIDYRLVPMGEITDQARLIAVRWMEGFEEWMKSDIPHKHKLASDIMNYARHYHQKAATEEKKQEAIGFAKWLRDNTIADGAPKILLLDWERRKKDKSRYTIDELYDIYSENEQRAT